MLVVAIFNCYNPVAAPPVESQQASQSRDSPLTLCCFHVSLARIDRTGHTQTNQNYIAETNTSSVDETEREECRG